jgi:hypothetical protein
MRLTKILTPEIILGTRGPEHLIYEYKNTLSIIRGVGGIKGMVQIEPHAGDWYQSLHISKSSAYELAWKFKNEGGRVYHVGKDFAKGISEIDKDIPVDLFPERFLAYFSFAENTFVIDGMMARGGFIFVGPWNETSLLEKPKNAERVIWLSFDFDTNDTPERLKYGSVLYPLSSSIHRELKDNTSQSVSGIDRALINLALYVSSTDPSLLPTKAQHQLSNSERKKFYNKYGVANLCTIPVILVSWNYSRPVTFNVESTTVSGHFRWQRHGPNNGLIKLIFIAEHERQYRNKTDLDISESTSKSSQASNKP